MIENRRKILYGCLLLWLAGCAVAVGGEISVSSTIDKTEIAFEDEVQLTVELKWQGDITAYGFEILPLPETEKFKIAGSGSSISSVEKEGTEYTIRSFKFTFRPTLSGTGIIRPITFNYVAWPDSLPGQLTTQEYQILIAEPIPAETESGFSTAVIIFIIIGILIIGTAAAFIIIRKRPGPMEPTVSSEEIFIRDMEQIKKDHHDNRQAFFGGLHKILLNYLNNRFQMQTAGKTMGTIKEEVAGLDIPHSHQEKMIQLLETAETEKFAPRRGEPGDILRLCAELENHFRNISNKNISEV